MVFKCPFLLCKKNCSGVFFKKRSLQLKVPPLFAGGGNHENAHPIWPALKLPVPSPLRERRTKSLQRKPVHIHHHHHHKATR